MKTSLAHTIKLITQKENHDVGQLKTNNTESRSEPFMGVQTLNVVSILSRRSGEAPLTIASPLLELLG